MNDTTMTITGNVVDEPRLRKTSNGHAVATFRLASTSRRFDRERGCFIDNATLFVTVTSWRQLAENVGSSVHKGQPVVVTGRYIQREWTADEQARTSYELEAMAVGHDLSRGTTEFTRVYSKARTVTVAQDSQGRPLDLSDHYLDLAEEPSEPEMPEASPADDALVATA